MKRRNMYRVEVGKLSSALKGAAVSRAPTLISTVSERGDLWVDPERYLDPWFDKLVFPSLHAEQGTVPEPRNKPARCFNAHAMLDEQVLAVCAIPDADLRAKAIAMLAEIDKVLITNVGQDRDLVHNGVKDVIATHDYFGSIRDPLAAAGYTAAHAALESHVGALWNDSSWWDDFKYWKPAATPWYGYNYLLGIRPGSARVDAMWAQVRLTTAVPLPTTKALFDVASEVAKTTTQMSTAEKGAHAAAALAATAGGPYGIAAAAAIEVTVAVWKFVTGCDTADQLKEWWKSAYERYGAASQRLISQGLPFLYNLPAAYPASWASSSCHANPTITNFCEVAERDADKMLALPEAEKSAMRAVWSATMRNKDEPTVAKMLSAFPGGMVPANREVTAQDLWNFGVGGSASLASDEQVMQVGIPVAIDAGLDPLTFCKRLYASGAGWASRPELLVMDSAGTYNNARQVQLATLSEAAIKLMGAMGGHFGRRAELQQKAAETQPWLIGGALVAAAVGVWWWLKKGGR